MENRAAGMQTRTHMAGQLCRWQLYSLWHRVDHTEWGLGKQQVLVEPLLDAWLLWFPSSGLPGSCACCKPEDPQRRSTFLCSLTSLSRVSVGCICIIGVLILVSTMNNLFLGLMGLPAHKTGLGRAECVPCYGRLWVSCRCCQVHYGVLSAERAARLRLS